MLAPGPLLAHRVIMQVRAGALEFSAVQNRTQFEEPITVVHLILASGVQCMYIWFPGTGQLESEFHAHCTLLAGMLQSSAESCPIRTSRQMSRHTCSSHLLFALQNSRNTQHSYWQQTFCYASGACMHAFTSATCNTT